jgi:hypothetical protein
VKHEKIPRRPAWNAVLRMLRVEYHPRRFGTGDWSARHHDNDDNQHVGYGATAEQAIADLNRLDRERDEADQADEATRDG